MNKLLASVVIGLALTFSGSAYAQSSDDSSGDSENVGVEPAEDLNNAGSDAGNKHTWNPGGWAIKKITEGNEKLFGGSKKKEEEEDK